MISLTTVVLPWPFSPISAMRSPGRSWKLKSRQHSPFRPGISKGDIPELESLPNWPRHPQTIHLRLHRRLHLEERQQIGKEQRLVGNAGSRREDLLQVRARLHDGVRQQVELADIAVLPADRPPDHEDIRAVVAQRCDNPQQAARNQLPSRQRDVLFVDLLGERGEAAGEELAQVEELQFLGTLAAARDLPQIVHLPLGRRLAEVLRVAQEGEVRLAQEGRQDPPSASSSTSQGEYHSSSPVQITVVMLCCSSRPICWIIASRSVAWTRARSSRS